MAEIAAETAEPGPVSRARVAAQVEWGSFHRIHFRLRHAGHDKNMQAMLRFRNRPKPRCATRRTRGGEKKSSAGKACVRRRPGATVQMREAPPTSKTALEMNSLPIVAAHAHIAQRRRRLFKTT